MRYEVVLAPEAARSYRALRAHRRAEVRDALERHLRHEPARVSKSRIKRLRGLSQPQYRLRVGEVRVFYDVTREAVQVLAIITKAEAARWLAEHATPSTPGSPGRGQGRSFQIPAVGRVPGDPHHAARKAGRRADRF